MIGVNLLIMRAIFVAKDMGLIFLVVVITTWFSLRGKLNMARLPSEK